MIACHSVVLLCLLRMVNFNMTVFCFCSVGTSIFLYRICRLLCFVFFALFVFFVCWFLADFWTATQAGGDNAKRVGADDASRPDPLPR